MAKNPKYRRLYRVIKAVRQEFPTDRPVIVRRKRLKNHFGFCSQGENYYYIYLDDRLSEDLAIYFYLHEIAHAATFEDQLVDHGASWTKMYGKIYKFYEKMFLK